MITAPHQFWQTAQELEGLLQLRADLHDALGRLVTKCHQNAAADPGCGVYWTAEAIYWEQQYRESIKLVEQMIHQLVGERIDGNANGRQIQIENVSGDVIITQIGAGAQNVAAGKDITQTQRVRDRAMEEQQ